MLGTLPRILNTTIVFYTHSIGNQRRTRWWCLKCVVVYPARDILPFVMYCVNGNPRSSLLIESTDSIIYIYIYIYVYIGEKMCT